MKRITCEMCGSTDLLKKDGLFECQSCGTKYTVEEAKKMMVEGTVQVEGTVKIDSTNKINNLIKNAKILYKDDKTKEAYNLFGEVLNIDTENYIAIAYRGLCSAWETTVSSPKLLDAIKGVARSFEIAEKELGLTEKYVEFIKEIMDETHKIIIACMNLYDNHYTNALNRSNEQLKELQNSLSRSGLYADTHWYAKRANEEKRILDNSVDNAVTGIHMTLTAANILFIKVNNNRTRPLLSSKDLEKIKEYIQETMIVPKKYLKLDIEQCKVSLGMLIKIEDDIKKKEQEEREAFFKQHPERKKELDEILEKCGKESKENEKKLIANKKRLDEITEIIETKTRNFKEDIKKLEKENKNFEDKIDSLGMFKIKEKRTLYDKIDENNKTIEDLKSKIDKTEKMINKEHEKEIIEINKITKECKRESRRIAKVLEETSIELFGESDIHTYECENCGAILAEHDKVCPECGIEFE